MLGLYIVDALNPGIAISSKIKKWNEFDIPSIDEIEYKVMSCIYLSSTYVG